MSDTLVDILKAMADPLRLRIVALLGREELAVGELAEVLDMGQSRISHHLKVLREAGLILVRHEGAWSFCSLVTAANGRAGAMLVEAMESWGEDLTPRPDDQRRLTMVLEARRERSRSFFDAAAGRGEILEPCLEGSGIRHQALSTLVPSDLVLADIGCGSGFMTQALATRAARVILVDHSEATLENARVELGQSLPAKLEFRVGELESLPLADEEVDGAFVNLVLHHVADLRTALGELARAIRPGGALVVSDMLPHDAEWLRDEHADLRLGLDPVKLGELARDSGFEQVHVEAGADQLRAKSDGGQEALLPLFVMKARRRRSS